MVEQAADEVSVVVIRGQPTQGDAAGERRGQPKEPVDVACIKGQHDAVKRYRRSVRGDAGVGEKQGICVPGRVACRLSGGWNAAARRSASSFRRAWRGSVRWWVSSGSLPFVGEPALTRSATS